MSETADYLTDEDHAEDAAQLDRARRIDDLLEFLAAFA